MVRGLASASGGAALLLGVGSWSVIPRGAVSAPFGDIPRACCPAALPGKCEMLMLEEPRRAPLGGILPGVGPTVLTGKCGR
ncbi:hypothetical protein PR003_g22979 [Phytophthora rubi]|uniref:Uncharacterized protein n=1 Tax=Phytophthora rubi TaxID=129364 RepID=A0A6A3J044_9STRA|nr:hypothetical protein PR002_g21689 [Phytophthora rubi]KAE9011075.1 hypothetical protein PR001_g16007 [Phytophthora rubi]KAE9299496.1 hypothetical protein PR003_g22979 [Phytophthora rubi]